MKLVDGDYITEGLSHFNDRVNGDPHFINGIETAKEMIENTPTVDAVPVEWIESMLQDWKKSGASFETCGAIGAMLTRWKREQEAR